MLTVYTHIYICVYVCVCGQHIYIYIYKYVDWLVGCVLWIINLCRLFNAKSFFMQIVSSISKNFV